MLDGHFHAVAHDVVGEHEVHAQELLQPLRHGGEGRLGVPAAISLGLGPSEMRGKDQAHAAVQGVLDGGHCFTDAGIIGDADRVAAEFQRYVEVEAHEHALAFDFDFINALDHGITLKADGGHVIDEV